MSQRPQLFGTTYFEKLEIVDRFVQDYDSAVSTQVKIRHLATPYLSKAININNYSNVN